MANYTTDASFGKGENSLEVDLSLELRCRASGPASLTPGDSCRNIARRLSFPKPGVRGVVRDTLHLREDYHETPMLKGDLVVQVANLWAWRCPPVYADRV